MKKPYLFKIIIFVTIFFVGLYISSINDLESYAEFSLDAEEDMLSEDQQKLIDVFGYPDIFYIMEIETFRFEIWTYFEWKRDFSFMNGMFQEGKPQDGVPPGFGWPSLHPTQFRIGMTEADVKKILNEPTAIGRITTGEMKGVIIYDYFDQVKIAFKDGKLFYARTLPVQVD